MLHHTRRLLTTPPHRALINLKEGYTVWVVDGDSVIQSGDGKRLVFSDLTAATAFAEKHNPKVRVFVRCSFAWSRAESSPALVGTARVQSLSGKVGRRDCRSERVIYRGCSPCDKRIGFEVLADCPVSHRNWSFIIRY